MTRNESAVSGAADENLELFKHLEPMNLPRSRMHFAQPIGYHAQEQSRWGCRFNGWFLVLKRGCWVGMVALLLGGTRDAGASPAAWGLNSSGQIGDCTTANRSSPVFSSLSVQFQAIAARGSHVVGLTASGSVICWGDNTFGQLGAGNVTKRLEPSEVAFTGPLAGNRIRAIASGRQHCLVVTESGKLAAWGANSRGQLGDGTYVDRWSPVEPVLRGQDGTPTFIAVAAGDEFSVALTSDGRVFTWGRNSDGQLGNGTFSGSNQPTAISLEGIRLISAGGSHGHAVSVDGRLWAWGRNAEGQLGVGTYDEARSPVAVRTQSIPAGVPVTSIVGGAAHTMMLTSGGAVYSWGLNSSGQLGDGTAISRNAPGIVAPVSGMGGNNAAAISAGESHSLAVTSSGTVFAWGSNSSSELGDGSTQVRLLPVSLVSRGVLAGQSAGLVAAGSGFSVAEVTSTNPASPPVAATTQASMVGLREALLNATVSVRGGPAAVRFEYGRTIGYGSLAEPGEPLVTCSASTPVSAWITGLLPDTTYHYRIVASNSSGVSVGENRTFRTTHSLIAGWGRNEGRLNFQGAPVQRTPVACSLTGYISRQRVVSISAGVFNPLILDRSGIPYLWGPGYHAGLGVSTTGIADTRPSLAGSPAARQLPEELGGIPIAQAVAGEYHHFLITGDGRLFGFGSNDNGQLGIGNVTPQGIPTEVVLESPDTPVRAVACGNRCTLILTAAGRVLGCGRNTSGLLGPIDTESYLFPVPVSSDGLAEGTRLTAVSSRSSHALALTEDGRVFAWGSNSNGQLGTDGTDTSFSIMTEVSGLGAEKIVSVAAGYTHSLALAQSGALFAWGSNGHGELGDGTTVSRTTPVRVQLTGGLADLRVVQLAAGRDYSAALTSSGLVFAWGSNAYGQLGNGALQDRSTPGPVDSSALLNGLRVDQIAAGENFMLALARHRLSVAESRQISSGAFEVSFFTDAGTGYEIQVSSGADPFRTVETVHAEGPLTRWIDSAASGPVRFYRVLRP